MCLTSAVFGTLSQKTSIFMSPWDVCSVTDMLMVADCRLRGAGMRGQNCFGGWLNLKETNEVVGKAACAKLP